MWKQRSLSAARLLTRCSSCLEVVSQPLVIPLKPWCRAAPCRLMQWAKVSKGQGVHWPAASRREVCVCVCGGYGVPSKHRRVCSSCETHTTETTERLAEQDDRYRSPARSSYRIPLFFLSSHSSVPSSHQSRQGSRSPLKIYFFQDIFSRPRCSTFYSFTKPLYPSWFSDYSSVRPSLSHVLSTAIT